MNVRSSRDLLIKLAIAGGLAVGSVTLLVLGHDVQAVLQYGLDLIRNTGPAMFFLCMLVLPAVGAPISVFSVTAGLVFSPQLGIPLVLALSLVAITGNMALSYLLAKRALRPPLEFVLSRLGYHLPRVGSADVADLIVLLRATPGMPFPVQNYLLGLAAVPFVRYLLISSLIVLPINAAFLLLGEALLKGKGKIALMSLLLLLALMTAIRMVRKHYSAKALPPGGEPVRAPGTSIRAGVGG